MEQPCPWCGRSSQVWSWARDLNRTTVTDRFTYYRCPDCGVLFLEPVPADLTPFYPSTYYELPCSREQYGLVAEAERFKLALVADSHAPGRLLEIGPGGGCFAYLAQEAGFEVEVLELSSEVCASLEEVLGLRTHQGQADPSTFRGLGPYDVITLWHAVEHLADPRATLDAAVAEMAPGGIVLIAAPNPRSLQLRLLRRRWPHLDAPRHLRLIPVPTLVRWAELAGLEVVTVTYTDPGSLAWNRFGWAEWAANLIRLDRHHGARWQRGLGRVLRRIGAVIEWVMRPLERVSDRGATYVVILRRPSVQGHRTRPGSRATT